MVHSEIIFVWCFLVTFMTNTIIRKPNKDGQFRKEVENMQEG